MSPKNKPDLFRDCARHAAAAEAAALLLVFFLQKASTIV
jgi:hypothetical protein